MSTQTLKQRYDEIGDVGKHSNVKPKDLIPISENEVGASLKGTTVESIHTLELEEVNPFNNPVTDSKVIITKEGKAYSVNVGDMIGSEVHVPEIDRGYLVVDVLDIVNEDENEPYKEGTLARDIKDRNLYIKGDGETPLYFKGVKEYKEIPEPKEEEDEGRYLAWTMSNDLHWKKAIGLEEQLGGPIGIPSQSGIIKLYADDSNSWQKVYISVKKG